MQSNDGPGTDVVTYGTMMKGLGLVGEVDEAWVLMERWERRMRRRVERSSRFYAISRPPQPPPLDLLASLMNAFAEQVRVWRLFTIFDSTFGDWLVPSRRNMSRVVPYAPGAQTFHWDSIGASPRRHLT